MRNFLMLLAIWFCMPVWSKVQLLELEDHDPIETFTLADAIIKKLTATPTIDAHNDIGLRMVIDDVKYYIQPTMFMAKSSPDEVCHRTGNVLAYQCKEGQRLVEGCHLLFFNAKGEWVGWHSMAINELQYPHYCNAFPAMGVADKSNNELLITMQYFLADGGVAEKVSNIGSNWIRMTSLIRVKANNGKIEVEQDDTCFGNPNKVNTIVQARKLLQRCNAGHK